MAQAAESNQQAPRFGLSRAQRAKIRGWRSDLGHTIWNFNESKLMHELRRKYEMEQPWTEDEIEQATAGVESIVLIALEIHKEMSTFVNRGGRLRKDARPMAKQYLDRLKGAVEGIWLGVGYLRKLMPDNIHKFDLAMMLADVSGLRPVDKLFFGFCPVEPAASEKFKESARMKLLEDRIEELDRKEYVFRNMGDDGMVKEAQETKAAIRRQLKRGSSQSIFESGGCYTNGMKALRAAVTQMFYTLQARDVRRVRLTEDDSRFWSTSMEEMGEPPHDMVKQFQEWADDEGRVLHIYDDEGYLVYLAMPTWYVGEDPESLAQRSALKKSKKARNTWGYDWDMATPEDARMFKGELSEADRKKVTEFLRQHPHRTFSIHEIAALTDIDIEPLSDKPAWFPVVYSGRLASEEPFHFEPNAAEMRESDTALDVYKDHGMIEALWKMDL